ncbi:hypothetical protein Clacol_004961 [Clathrus columnatus]|uniref:Uncharacterized protein n=1 Tax=Clathrus columnatus TaxID=1419009 RepID=A0AAV5ADF8_9AGAM|nr:hypothetical protein Clacol_004961 [Clathrus columnatus]
MAEVIILTYRGHGFSSATALALTSPIWTSSNISHALPPSIMQDHIPGELHVGACTIAKKKGREADRLAKNYRKAKFDEDEFLEVDMNTAKMKTPAWLNMIDVASRFAIDIAGPSSVDSVFADQVMDSGNEVESFFDNSVGAGRVNDPNMSVMQSEAPLMEQRPQRKKFLPWKRREMLPEGPGPLLIKTTDTPNHIELLQPETRYVQSSVQIAPGIRLHLTKQIQTASNCFGLYRTYYALPSQIPDENIELEQFSVDTNERIIISSDYSDNLHSLWPYPNISCFRLGKWWLDGATKSSSAFRKLIQNVFRAPDFCLNDIIDAPWDYINTQLASRTTKGFSDDWAKHSVSIRIPSGIKKTKKQMKRPEKEDISIENQFFTVDGILLGYKIFSFQTVQAILESPDSPGSGIHVYDEIYTSDAFHKAHKDLQNSPKEPAWCNLAMHRYGLSISTGEINQNTNAAIHQQMLASILPTFQRGIQTWNCDSIIEQYNLEDVSLLIDMGCRLPRKAHRLGTLRDQRIRTTHAHIDCDSRRTKISIALNLINEKGFAIDSKRVNFFLKHGSWAPIENAFSSQLGFTDFSYFQMLTCDLMHEVELGVWKALLIHLIQMLWSVGPVLAFGQSIIHHFADNMSDLKNLLPEPYNGHIISLIWALSTWHALAKLRMHTETTLAHLDTATTILGKLSQSFVDDICPHLMTLETPSEMRAQIQKNESNIQQKSTKLDCGFGWSKKFNINTFKFHMLGHYVNFIHLYGTMDSYSTMIGETAHHIAKDFLCQLAKLDSMEQTLKGIEEDLQTSGVLNTSAREESTFISPTEEFSISTSNQIFFNVGEFCAKHEDDPAVKDFINLSTKKQDIMVKANEDEKTHPYWYARVHGIFHAQVQL